MKTIFEVMNIDLAQEYTKERKKEAATSLNLDGDLHKEVFAAIDDMDIPDNDDRYHWIQHIGRAMGVDLITIGKVQPEHMLRASALSTEDFTEAVKVCTATARTINDTTVAAEKEFATESVPQTL